MPGMHVSKRKDLSVREVFEPDDLQQCSDEAVQVESFKVFDVAFVDCPSLTGIQW